MTIPTTAVVLPNFRRVKLSILSPQIVQREPMASSTAPIILRVFSFSPSSIMRNSSLRRACATADRPLIIGGLITQLPEKINHCLIVSSRQQAGTGANGQRRAAMPQKKAA